ncbi:MAG: T9SS type A sorting domain-containing protein [Bacteroidales bacterium]|nr:T9SS type A sorting domain-containing protein [Bacteroidales bacterium]MCF8402427.1 T9SS type A sorting domain-containing protein [Bacteroidales bacterium]
MRKNLAYLTLLVILPFILFSQSVTVPKSLNMTIESGSRLILNDGFNLLIKADSEGTGSVIDKNSSNAILFSGGGEADVEMFLVDDDWHYISSPVNQELSGAFWDVYLKKFSEPDSAWFYITSTDTILHPMQGYAAWASSSLTEDTTIVFRGLLNAGSYSRNLTNTGAASHGSKGFNFVGNPFPSAIDWQVGSEGWTRTNIDPIIYLWNPVAGQYGSYNRNLKVGTNSVDSIIPPKQGFFVHVTTNGTGFISVNNNAQLHHHKAFFKAGEVNDFSQLLIVKVAGNGFSDESIIYFKEEATAAYDASFDSFKLNGKGEAPQLYTMAGTEKLAINTMKNISENEIVPLFFESGEEGQYLLNFSKIESFEPDIPIYLEDIPNEYFQDLRENPEFAFYSSPDEDAGRFNIHFADPMSVYESPLLSMIQVYSENHNIHVKLPIEFQADIEVLNLIGQPVCAVKNGSGHQTLTVRQDNTFYLVVIRSNQGNFTKKILIK